MNICRCKMTLVAVKISRFTVHLPGLCALCFPKVYHKNSNKFAVITQNFEQDGFTIE